MLFNRRQFVSFASALLSAPLIAVGKSAGKDNIPLLLSAASDADDNHWVIGFSMQEAASSEIFKHALPARAHHIAVHEGLGIYVVIARRPGNYLWIGDLDSGKFLGQVEVPADRHLYGHGVFSAKGDSFYTTENAYALVNGDSGRVVAWDVNRDNEAVSFTRRVEFPSYGTGPHELLMQADQQTLVVANGGIRTHPDQGREKLNIDSMQPSLAYIDAANGNLLEQHFLDAEFHQASIRHLDQNDDGLVIMGMQYQGEPFHHIPLVATHARGSVIRPLWAPEPQQSQMSQYVGSIRFDNSGRYFAATCPRGNMITFWATGSGEMLNSVRSRDGCGICAVDRGFVFTAGTGRITRYELAEDTITDLETQATGKVFWDNHLSMFAV